MDVEGTQGYHDIPSAAPPAVPRPTAPPPMPAAPPPGAFTTWLREYNTERYHHAVGAAPITRLSPT